MEIVMENGFVIKFAFWFNLPKQEPVIGMVCVGVEDGTLKGYMGIAETGNENMDAILIVQKGAPINIGVIFSAMDKP